MWFRFYTNALSNVTRNLVIFVFLIGLVLIGFGVLILAVPELFAFLAALVFFLAGSGCLVFAAKVYLTGRRFGKFTKDEMNSYRKNVQVHIEDDDDFF